MKEPKNIVVRMPNWLGDAVMASPILQLLKESYPNSKLSLYGKAPVISLFQSDPFVSSRLILNPSDSTKSQVQKLKDQKFDLGILLTNSFSSAWLFFKSKIPTRIGFSKDMRGWMLTHSLRYPKDKAKMHHVELYQMLLSKMSISKSLSPKLYVTGKEKSSASDFLSSYKSPLIGVNASAAFGSSKCWPKERFRELSMELTEQGAHLIFFGDESAKEKNDWIISGIKNCTNLAGETSIRTLMALIEKCDLFLTNDSGPMHIACALNTPVVALFGSTSPEATGPYGRALYIKKEVPCSPCFKRECPIDFRCMRSIETHEVYQTVQNQIKKYATDKA